MRLKRRAPSDGVAAALDRAEELVRDAENALDRAKRVEADSRQRAEALLMAALQEVDQVRETYLAELQGVTDAGIRRVLEVADQVFAALASRLRERSDLTTPRRS